jgi:hypothetical protein
MNTAVYPRKELTFESPRKKVDSVGTTVVSCIVFMNTSSGLLYFQNFFADFPYKTSRIKYELLGDSSRHKVRYTTPPPPRFFVPENEIHLSAMKTSSKIHETFPPPRSDGRHRHSSQLLQSAGAVNFSIKCFLIQGLKDIHIDTTFRSPEMTYKLTEKCQNTEDVWRSRARRVGCRDGYGSTDLRLYTSTKPKMVNYWFYSLLHKKQNYI